MPIVSIGTPVLWAGFLAFVLAVIAADLGLFQREGRAPTPREALSQSALWVSLSLGFAAFLWARFGKAPALEFITGYLLEKSLSVDNVFVFLVLFAAFRVPRDLERRVLSLGVIGALVLRGAFILGGSALLSRFHWVEYGFGALLLFTGGKLLAGKKGEPEDPAGSLVVRALRRMLPLADGYRGRRLLVVENGARKATMLLLVVAVVELSDLIFALDSIPATFGVTHDPFLVLSSNMFAILGLRALYFAVSGALHSFEHLETGLSLTLLFLGAKILLASVLTVPTSVTLAVVALLLSGPPLLGLLFRRARPVAPPAAPPLAAPGDDHHAS